MESEQATNWPYVPVNIYDIMRLGNLCVSCQSQSRSRIEQTISVYDGYIKLLGEELDEVAGIAAVHGWVSSRSEQGQRYRDAIIDQKRIWGIEETKE